MISEEPQKGPVVKMIEKISADIAAGNEGDILDMQAKMSMDSRAPHLWQDKSECTMVTEGDIAVEDLPKPTAAILVQSIAFSLSTPYADLGLFEPLKKSRSTEEPLQLPKIFDEKAFNEALMENERFQGTAFIECRGLASEENAKKDDDYQKFLAKVLD